MKKDFKLSFWQKTVVILILVLAFILKMPFLNVPLDYDEGFYAFKAFFSGENRFHASSLPLLKFPGITFTYRFLDGLFPGQIAAFRIAATLLNILATFGIYKLGKRLYKSNVGIFSALIFAIITSQIATESPANTEFFMMPFTVLAFWLFWLFLEKRKLTWLTLSALSAGMAFLYKQVALFEAIFLGLWLLLSGLSLQEKSWTGKLKNILRQSLIFLIGFLGPFFATVLFFFFKNELAGFWQQSFGSGIAYVATAWGEDWFARLKDTSRFLWLSLWPFWLISLGGLITSFLKFKKEYLFVAGWGLLALAGACFNGWFFPHYFIQIIPPISLLAGLFLSSLFKGLKEQCQPNRLLMNVLPVVIISLALFLMTKNQWFDYLNYWQMIRGKISPTEYLREIGFDITETGWLPFYESAEYLRNKMREEDSIFVWSTTPLPYYLVRKNPTTSFIYYYPLLDYKFMLPTYKGWQFDFEANRQQLMEELISNPPEYLLIHVSPEQIFDQMLLFKEFSRFIGLNYEFEKQFGNILIFKINKNDRLLSSDESLIPLELIKRFSAIIKVEEKKDKAEVIFEPMVSPNGTLRQLSSVYPGLIKIKFEPIILEFLGQDGADFVGVARDKPSGKTDLHIRIKDIKKAVSFLRIKLGETTWNNKAYGVNPLLKMIKNAYVLDFFFEPPWSWRGRRIEVYLIYEDGSLSREEIISQ